MLQLADKCCVQVPLRGRHYSPQKGRFETLTHEAINKPTTDSHLDTALISKLQHPVHPNISSLIL